MPAREAISMGASRAQQCDIRSKCRGEEALAVEAQIRPQKAAQEFSFLAVCPKSGHDAALFGSFLSAY